MIDVSSFYVKIVIAEIGIHIDKVLEIVLPPISCMNSFIVRVTNECKTHFLFPFHC